jgi:pyruvate/2-oxoglutarate dehydrogenase complex dihydrolipoamide acyltransferase (E2) component
MINIKMPEAGFSITEGTILKWYKNVGEQVAEGENVVSVETDKITVDIPAEKMGVLREIRCKEGDVVPVGEIMGIIGDEGALPSEVLKPAVQSSVPAEQPEGIELKSPGGLQKIVSERRVSPAAKAVAKARRLDLTQISSGSGPGGRIVKKDVYDFIAKTDSAGLGRAGAPEEIPRAPSVRGPSKQSPNRVEFKGWRRVIADRLSKSAREIPHYSMSVEADVTELSGMIQKLREKKEDLHITYLPFMMSAMVRGVLQVPHINSHCDKDGYTVFDQVNIGVAVDLGEKLLVPVVKDVSSKSILELVRELDSLVKKARTDKLEAHDIEGGTITLTNVGMFQTVSATSIIMPPQVAILYMGVAKDVPAVHDGNIEIRKIMTLGATYDHRVVNGAAGGRFLMKVKECMEDIGAFLLHIS